MQKIGKNSLFWCKIFNFKLTSKIKKLENNNSQIYVILRNLVEKCWIGCLGVVQGVIVNGEGVWRKLEISEFLDDGQARILNCVVGRWWCGLSPETMCPKEPKFLVMQSWTNFWLIWVCPNLLQIKNFQGIEHQSFTSIRMWSIGNIPMEIDSPSIFDPSTHSSSWP